MAALDVESIDVPALFQACAEVANGAFDRGRADPLGVLQMHLEVIGCSREESKPLVLAFVKHWRTVHQQWPFYFPRFLELEIARG
jgi:hypothetical protein